MDEQEIKHAISLIQQTIKRCEHIQPKFVEGTSQHTLLRSRIQALVIAQELLVGNDPDSYSLEALETALPPIVSILHKCQKAQSNCTEDTSQYRRLAPMIQAMRIAQTVLENSIKKKHIPHTA